MLVILDIYKTFINDKNYNQKKQLFWALFFMFFLFVGLGIDSVYFLQNYFDGRILINCYAIIHFSLFFYVSNSYLRKLMFVMVFLSYLGELLCCDILGMYHYRTDEIPLYVPFGHSILYATGYVFSETKWAKQNDEFLRRIFILFFIILFLAVGIFLTDIFTLIFGCLFFMILKRKKWKGLYFFMSICIVILELIGTYYNCWEWFSIVLWIFPTVNPPMGAVFIYIGGDIILTKLVAYLERKINFIVS